MNLLHERFPQRCGIGAAIRSLLQLVGRIVMADPDACRIIGRHARKVHARIVRVRPRLAGNGHPVDFGLGSGSGFDGVGEHIDQQICGGLLEYAMRIAHCIGIKNDIAVRIQHLRKGKRLAVYAAGSNRAVGCRHLDRRQAGGSEREPRAIPVDFRFRRAQFHQIVRSDVDAHILHEHAGSHHVQGGHDTAANRDRAVTALQTTGRIALLRVPPLDRAIHIGNDRCGRHAQIQRGSIDRKRFDGRADLGIALIGTVLSAPDRRFIPAAHDRAQLAGVVVQHHRSGLRLLDGDHGAVRHGFLANRLAPVRQRGIVLPGGQRLLHRILDIRIHGGIDVVSAGTELIFNGVPIGLRVRQIALYKQVRDDIIDRVFDKIRHVVHLFLLALLDDANLFHQCGFILFPIDISGLIHAREHLIRPVVGDLHLIAAVHIAPRVVVVRALRQACEHGAFPDGQLRKIFSEIVHRGRLHAVIGFTQIDIIQIGFENIVLADHPLQLQRQIRLLNLALIVALRTQDFVLDQLLRNRAAAGRIAVSENLERCGKQALEINAGMLVKSHILHGDERVFQHIGNILNVGPIAILHIGNGRDEAPVHIIEKGCAVGDRQLCHIDFRRCFHIRLPDAEDEPDAGKSDHDKRKDQQLERCKQNRKRKRPRRLMLLKQRLFFQRGGTLPIRLS